MTLPVALTGTDVIGQAKTGTGKTLGFGLPLLERVTVPADVEAGRAQPEALTDTPQALVVVPTRELCVQVTNDLLTAGKVRNVRVTAIYGGRAYEPQVEALKKGVDVVVGTPGRLLDLAGQKKLNLKHVKSLVLDEADEMLDLGFLPDVEKIIGMLPVKRQTMLFSATMPGAVIGLARRYMSQPTHIRATAPDDEGATVANIKQFVYRAHSLDKPEMIARILQAEGRGLAMIFCRTKRTAADIAEQLQRRGFASGSVHGDLGQGAREQALRAFRNGKVDVLVCTDVAARGIDVEGVTHVINYQSPEDEKTYLHRVGRTGRAGAKGTAITLVDWDDIPRWQLINKSLDLDFNDPVETYSSSPHLFAELGIPEGTKGVLPRSERTRAGLDAEKLEDLGETGGRGARGRGGRGEARPADRERSADRERPARTPRRRRRTRGGAPLDSAPATPTAGTSADVPVEATVTEEASTPRRRRRLRGGAPTQPVTAHEPTAPSGHDEPVESAEAATTTAEGTALDVADATDAPAKSRRRRTRKSAEQAVTTAPVETGTEVAPEPAASAESTAEAALDTAGSTADQPEAKPRRRTRKAATAAEAAVDTAEGTTDEAETKPRRRTRKATAAAAEAAVDTAEGTADEPETKPRRRTRKATAAATTADAPEAAVEAKPRRTRKTAATVAAEIPPQPADGPDSAAEAAVDVAEGAEAKPRRRTRKAATAPEAVADTAEGTTDEAATKPRRRTRKAAETADAPVTDEATAAKPRRTRKATATADAAEAAVDTAEAKPRRTRKAAAATAEAETKPRRRTRKAAEAPAEADDTAGGPAAEPKPRRTRKTAAAKAAVDTAEIPAQTTGKAAAAVVESIEA
ncbi:DEAD/DEAH box helicase [Streptomyces cyslabdanicus]|uniref:DEAD/DEAH box helicase n=1 Tax=Streptomyces cyslabdanicus TaxID=1470456 RepID=UPI004044C536